MTDTKTVGKRPRRPDSGEALMEIALVLPILLLLSMGMLDFGRAFWAKSLVDQASREAARVAAVTAPDIPLAEARGNQILNDSGIPGNHTTVVQNPDKTVTATVTYSFTFVTPGLFAMFSNGLNNAGGIDMTGKCVMRSE